LSVQSSKERCTRSACNREVLADIFCALLLATFSSGFLVWITALAAFVALEVYLHVLDWLVSARTTWQALP